MVRTPLPDRTGRHSSCYYQHCTNFSEALKANFVELRKGEVRAEGRTAGEREIGATVGIYGRLLLPHQLP
jgi:hypothetical protein